MAEVRAFSKQLDRGVSAEVTKAILRLGAAVYAESQKLVPVSSGYLKDSGSFRAHSNSVVIEYKAPYASEIEHGRPGLSGGYDTPSPRGITFGREAVRNYRGGQRPVPIGVRYDEAAPEDSWKVINLSNDLEPRHFIKKAFETIFGDGRRKGSLKELNLNMIPKSMK